MNGNKTQYIIKDTFNDIYTHTTMHQQKVEAYQIEKEYFYLGGRKGDFYNQ
jgi:hypothetical protein